jgi:diadenylate cyclase
MLSSIVDYFAGKSAFELAREFVDVAIVYYIVYRALLVLRGTRAMQIGIGLLLVFVLYVVAAQLHFVTLLSILGALIPGAVILIVVVVFQNDIRRGLMRMGSQPWFGFVRARESQAIDEVVEASTELARHRIGAIITFEQDANLDEFVGVNKGHVIDAAVSAELLVSIFLPEGVNKLHDGAVIIRNLRVAKAGVFFPMPESRVLDPSFGSRHRAALGITEETDAVVVVVSEERGTISFCFNGNIVANLDGPGLRRALEGVFAPSRRRRPHSAGKREAPVSQRLSTTGEAPAVREELTSVPELPEEPTLLSVEAEPGETPTTRIRTTTDEPEPRIPSEHPAPLRKMKGDKSEGDVTPAPISAPRLPLGTPLTTPMRAPSGQLGTLTKTDAVDGDDGPAPESEGGGEAS